MGVSINSNNNIANNAIAIADNKPVGVLTEEDRINIKLYSGTKPLTSVKRGIQYVIDTAQSNSKEKEEVALRILSISIPTIVGSTAIGAALGAVAGGILGAINSASILSAPGAVVGGKAGAVAGLGVGIVLAPYIVTIYVRQSDHYIQWKTKALQEKVYPLFQEFLKNDATFLDLLCPITKDLPLIPVRTPYGHVFEKAAIETWIETNPTCPLTRYKLHINDLVYAQDHVNNIVRRACALMRERQNNAPHIVEGLQAIVHTNTANSVEVLKAETAQFAENASKNKLSADQYAELCKNAFQRSVLANGS